MPSDSEINIKRCKVCRTKDLLHYESQIYSIMRVRSTQWWESDLLHYESQIYSIMRDRSTPLWESDLLYYERQIYSIMSVRSTPLWESDLLYYEGQICSIMTVRSTPLWELGRGHTKSSWAVAGRCGREQYYLNKAIALLWPHRRPAVARVVEQ